MSLVSLPYAMECLFPVVPKCGCLSLRTPRAEGSWGQSTGYNKKIIRKVFERKYSVKSITLHKDRALSLVSTYFQLEYAIQLFASIWDCIQRIKLSMGPHLDLKNNDFLPQFQILSLAMIFSM